MHIAPNALPGISSCSADKAQAPETNVKDEKRVNSETNSVPQHTRATKDAHTCPERPQDQDNVYGNARDPMESECREDGSNDEWKDGVADNAD